MLRSTQAYIPTASQPSHGILPNPQKWGSPDNESKKRRKKKELWKEGEIQRMSTRCEIDSVTISNSFKTLDCHHVDNKYRVVLHSTHTVNCFLVGFGTSALPHMLLVKIALKGVSQQSALGCSLHCASCPPELQKGTCTVPRETLS